MKIWWCAITEQAAETLAGHIFLTSIVCLFWCYGLFVYNLARFNPPFLFLFPSFPSISHIAVKAYLCFPKIYPFFFQTHGGFLSFVLFVLFVLFVFTQRGKGTDVQRKKKTRTRRIDQLDQFYVTICDKQFLETTPIRDNFWRRWPPSFQNTGCRRSGLKKLEQNFTQELLGRPPSHHLTRAVGRDKEYQRLDLVLEKVLHWCLCTFLVGGCFNMRFDTEASLHYTTRSFFDFLDPRWTGTTDPKSQDPKGTILGTSEPWCAHLIKHHQKPK